MGYDGWGSSRVPPPAKGASVERQAAEGAKAQRQDDRRLRANPREVQYSSGEWLFVEADDDAPLEFGNNTIGLSLPKPGVWLLSSQVAIEWTDALPSDGDVASFTAGIVADVGSAFGGRRCVDQRTLTYKTGDYTPYEATPGGVMRLTAVASFELQVTSSLAAGTWSGPGWLAAYYLGPT